MKNLSKYIAGVLKSLRKGRGWSLDKAAQETGVSKAMLGQIEREESSPTIATLWKIASGFQISFSYLLEEMDMNTEYPIYRSNLHQMNPAHEKICVTPIFPFDPQLNCEIFIIELLAGCKHLSLPHKPGVIEHVIVVEGTMDVLMNESWQPLQKGEGLRFHAHQPHGYRNLTAKSACFHNIIHYPTLHD